MYPVVFVQVLKEVVAPLGRRLGPDHFQTGGNGVSTKTAAVRAGPAQALRFKQATFWINPHMGRFPCPMGFPQRMPPGDQRDGLFIVHPHVAEGGADRRRRRQWFTAGVWPFRVHVDQPHLGGANGAFRQAFWMAMLKPGFFVTPVNVQIRFPHVFTSRTKAKGSKAGILQRDVTGKNKQVGPGDFLPIFLLDWPQQTTRLIEADVIRPGVERRETLLTTTRTATPVYGAIGTGAVPRHTDEQTGVTAPVCRPPRLGVRQQGFQIAFQSRVIKFAKFFAVVEVFA